MGNKEIITRLESQVAAFKGYLEFEKRVRVLAEEILGGMVDVTKRAYELGEEVVRFSETEDVRAHIEGMNRDVKESGRGGAPRKAHCWVAEQIAGLSGLSAPWMQKCARAYLEDRESGFQMGKKLAMLKARGVFSKSEENPLQLPMPDLYAAFHSQADREPQAEETPEQTVDERVRRLAKHVAREVMVIREQAGPRLKKILAGEKLAQTLEECSGWLQGVGLSIGVLPTGPRSASELRARQSQQRRVTK